MQTQASLSPTPEIIRIPGLHPVPGQVVYFKVLLLHATIYNDLFIRFPLMNKNEVITT